MKKNNSKKLSKTFSFATFASILIVSVSAGSMQSAFALTVIDTYDDKTAFLTDTGASTVGAIPDLGKIGTHPSSQAIGDATFSTVHSDQVLFMGTSGIVIPNDDWTTLTPGNDIAISDNEDLDISLTSPVYSFGFEFVEPSCTVVDDPCGNGDIGSNVASASTFDSEFEVTLKNGGGTIKTFTFNAPDDQAAFVGVWSNDPFDSVEIRETIGGIDNEYYGEFFTGDTPLVAVNVAKFYDANHNGIHDEDEVFLEDWLVHVNDTNSEFEFTNATYVLPGGEIFNATEFIPDDHVWIPTNDTTVTFNSTDVNEILFSNVCVGESGEDPHTKGFWSNKNGQELCKQYEENDAVSGNLTQFPNFVDSENAVKVIDECTDVVHDKSTKPPTKNYLKNPTHGNINYTLSQQLLTMVLNNATESVNPADEVYCNSIGQFFNLTSLMTEANATLAGVGSYAAGDLAECLDNANNDLNYVQDEACPYDFGTDVTVDKILTQNGILNETFIDGESYNYTITVTNTGSYPAVNTNLYDIMGINYQDLSPIPVDSCWTGESGVYSCNLGDLVGSGVLNIELSLFDILNGFEYSNHAVVNGTNFDEVDDWYNATETDAD